MFSMITKSDWCINGSKKIVREGISRQKNNTKAFSVKLIFSVCTVLKNRKLIFMLFSMWNPYKIVNNFL